MPYIEKKRREAMGNGEFAKTPGELNFEITQILIGYLTFHGKSYQTINDIVGALECAKIELYRRVAADYEDKKIKENGDVY